VSRKQWQTKGEIWGRRGEQKGLKRAREQEDNGGGKRRAGEEGKTRGMEKTKGGGGAGGGTIGQATLE